MNDYYIEISDHMDVNWSKLEQTYVNIDWIKTTTLQSPKKQRKKETLNWMQDDFYTHNPSTEDYEWKLVVDWCKKHGVYKYITKSTFYPYEVIGPTWCRYGSKTKLGIHKDHPAVKSNGMSRGCWLAICFIGPQPLQWYDDDKNLLGEIQYKVILSNAQKFHFADVMNTGEERVLVRTTFDQPYIKVRDTILQSVQTK